MELLIATTNPGKLREYQALLHDLPIRCLSLRMVGLDHLNVDEIGETFETIAERKAVAYAQASGLYTLADDTGLVVNALGGRPGLHSHRYGGPGLDDRGRYLKLLSEMEGVPDDRRTARFMCAVALVNPDTQAAITAAGVCEGHITRQPGHGTEGFGYDAIFQPDGCEAPLSTLSMDEKNRISHRGDAIQRLWPFLEWLAADV